MAVKVGTAYVDVVADFKPLNRQLARLDRLSAQIRTDFRRSMVGISRDATAAARPVARLSRQVAEVGAASRGASRRLAIEMREVERATDRTARAIARVERAQRTAIARQQTRAITGPLRSQSRGPSGGAGGIGLGGVATSVTASALVDAILSGKIRTSIPGSIGARGGYSTYDLARSLGRGRLASGAAQGGAFAMSGATAAKTFGGAFVRALPAGFAAVGVEQILTKAISGDFESAGAEAGGALALGVAGGFLAGPPGAAIGIGFGPFLGDQVKDAFEGDGWDIGNEIAGAAAKGFIENYGPELNKAVRHKDLGTLKSLRNKLVSGRRMAVEGDADPEAVAPLGRAIRAMNSQIKQIGVPRAHVFKQMGLLKSGMITRLTDINRLFQGNARTISFAWEKGSDEWRKVSVANMRSAVQAIRSGMNQGVITTSVGTRRIRALMRNIQLTEGRDPLRIARGFKESWKQAGEVNRSSLNRMLRDLRRMPKGARERAQDMMIQMAQTLERNGKLPRTSASRIRSALVGEFAIANRSIIRGVLRMGRKVGALFSDLADTVSRALQSIGINVNGVLRALGVSQTVDFAVTTVGNIAEGAVNAAGDALDSLGFQQGGFVVPGSGDGDTFRTVVPAGSFVLNRNASRAFQRGGQVPVALEPGEKVFYPGAVRRLGQGNLEAANAAVPRFQKGGSVGEPRIAGPSGALRAIGQAAVHAVFEGARDYLAQNKPRGGRPGFAGRTLTGKVSWFYGGETAGGSNTSRPGVALNLRPGTEGGWNNKTTQGWMTRSRAGKPVYARVTISGRTANLPITDLGPAGFTQRAIDVTEGGVRKLGLSLSHFPTDSIGTARILGRYQKGGLVDPFGRGRKGRGKLDGQPFNPTVMRGASASPPARSSGKGGFKPRTIDRIKAKADLISGNFTGYVWGGGHGEGTNVRANGLDCSGAVAKLMQQSGWDNFAVAHSSVYASRMQPGVGDLFTIWSNNEHTFADIEGRQWGTYSGGLGYHSHGTAGFTPRHPNLGKGVQAGGGAGKADGGRGRGDGGETIEGKYKRRRPGPNKSGGVEAPVTARYKVTTAPLRFGALPAELPKCNKELRQRQVEIGEYRAAHRQTKKKDTKEALAANIKLLEERIRQLRWRRARLVAERHQKKVATKRAQAAEFKFWNEPKSGLLAQRRSAFEVLSQNAEQWVATEPEEPATFTGDWVKTVLEPYIANKERPAYAVLLDHEREWRNDLVRAEAFANQRVGNWRDKITTLHEQIEEIRKLKKKEPKKWARLAPRIPAYQQEMKALRATIKKTQNEVIPAWWEELGEVQGLGRPREIVTEIPGTPTAEQFGGYIWDTQTAIRDLDLKIKQANENKDDNKDSELAELYKQLLIESNQRNVVRGIEEKVFASMPKVGSGFQAGGIVGVMPPYAGKAHVGAVVPGPPGQERTMVVKSGEGIFTPEQMAALGAGGEVGPVRVNVNGDIVSSHPDPVEVMLGDRRLVAEIRKVTGQDNRRQARGAGRGLATPGVFSR